MVEVNLLEAVVPCAASNAEIGPRVALRLIGGAMSRDEAVRQIGKLTVFGFTLNVEAIIVDFGSCCPVQYCAVAQRVDTRDEGGELNGEWRSRYFVGTHVGGIAGASFAVDIRCH